MESKFWTEVGFTFFCVGCQRLSRFLGYGGTILLFLLLCFLEYTELRSLFCLSSQSVPTSDFCTEKDKSFQFEHALKDPKITVCLSHLIGANSRRLLFVCHPSIFCLSPVHFQFYFG